LGRYGSGQEEIVQALEVLGKRTARFPGEARVPIVVNKMACPSLAFYTSDDPLVRDRLIALGSRSPEAVQRRLRGTLRRHGEIWVLFVHPLAPERRVYLRFLDDPSVKVVGQRRFPGADLARVSRSDARRRKRPGRKRLRHGGDSS